MGRGPLAFKQSDVTRAIKAAKAAGLTVQAIDVTTGKVIVTDTIDKSEKTIVKSWDKAIAEIESRRRR